MIMWTASVSGHTKMIDDEGNSENRREGNHLLVQADCLSAAVDRARAFGQEQEWQGVIVTECARLGYIGHILLEEV